MLLFTAKFTLKKNLYWIVMNEKEKHMSKVRNENLEERNCHEPSSYVHFSLCFTPLHPLCHSLYHFSLRQLQLPVNAHFVSLVSALHGHSPHKNPIMPFTFRSSPYWALAYSPKCDPNTTVHSFPFAALSTAPVIVDFSLTLDYKFPKDTDHILSCSFP